MYRYLEVQDISFHLRSNDRSLPEDSALAQWAGYMLQASVALGAPLDSVECVRDIMLDVGFQDVQQKAYAWPINTWPKDPHLKRLGKHFVVYYGASSYPRIGLWTFHDFASSLTGISVALFTRGLGWTTTELEVFLVDVRKDMQKRSIHAFWPMYVHRVSFVFEMLIKGCGVQVCNSWQEARTEFVIARGEALGLFKWCLFSFQPRPTCISDWGLREQEVPFRQL